MQFYDGHLSYHAAKVPGITSLDSSSALASAALVDDELYKVRIASHIT